MQNSKQFGKLFYGLGMAGIGGLQFIFPWFRPVLLPVPPEATQNITALVYLTGLALVAAGVFIAFGRQVKTTALLLGSLLLLFLVFGHLPNRLTNNPGMLGAWTDALKLLALSGGAFMVAGLFPENNTPRFLNIPARIVPYGKYFFGVMLLLFGIDHFLYIDFVKTLVPASIPGPEFWTYLTGAALMGAGLAILINFRPWEVGLLLAGMLGIWLVVLHIPRALAAPASDNGNEWTSVFQCLAFAGMALMWVGTARKGTFRATI